jgi:translation initiation factor 1 (eIF-1/SUI1)
MPYEYCSYGPSPAKCSETLLALNPSLHASIYPPQEPAASTGDDSAATTTTTTTTNTNTTVDGDDNNDNDNDNDNDTTDATTTTSAAPAVSKPKKSKTKQVRIVTSQRQKRKFITTISDLEAYNATKLPIVAKAFSKKFACQASATKDKDELLVQGDFAIEVAEALVADYGVKKSDIKIIREQRAQ